jgi:hypothetical protein
MTQAFSSTLAAPAASFDVTAIGAGFSHLMVVLVGRSDTAALNTGVILKINNDGGANYDSENLNLANTVVAGTAVAGATSKTITQIPAATATASTFGVVQFYLPFYSNTTVFKSIIAADNVFLTLGTVGTYGLDAGAGMWRSSAAINRVTLTPAAGNFIIGSAVTIYGIT